MIFLMRVLLKQLPNVHCQKFLCRNTAITNYKSRFRIEFLSKNSKSVGLFLSITLDLNGYDRPLFA